MVLSKLQTNLFIKPEVKKLISNNWKKLSSDKKKKIIDLLSLSNDIQNAFIKKAVNKNPKFI